MKRRTTIELDDELLARAKRVLGDGTTRSVVEEALRQLVEREEGARAERADRQRRYLAQLADRSDPEVLASEEMWR